MAETFDDAGYELGVECDVDGIVYQYIHPICHPSGSVMVRFEGIKSELPVKLRLNCTQCGAHVVTLPLAQDGREALVLGHPIAEGGSS